MTEQQQIRFFVLDSLANDIESLQDVLRILNSPTELGWRDQHPNEFLTEEVVPAMFECIRSGDVEACVLDEDGQLVDAGEGVIPAGAIESVWFRLTQQGRAALNAWTPPPLCDESDE